MKGKPLLSALLTAVVVAGCVTSEQASNEVVPMSQEPLHKQVLTNGVVTVYDVRLQPHDLMRFHAHPTNHLAVVIEPGVMSNEILGRTPVDNVTGPAGSVIYLAAGPAHRQSNISPTPIRFLAVELHSADEAARGSEQRANTPMKEGCTLDIEKSDVRVWRCLLSAGGSAGPHTRMPFLRIPITAGSVAIHSPTAPTENATFTAGTASWHDDAESAELINTGASPLEFVDVEVVASK